jgi:hypothetical protein
LSGLVKLRLNFREILDELPLQGAARKRSGDRVVQFVGQRAGVGGAQQVERRILTMSGPESVQLGAHGRHQLGFVTIPVVWSRGHLVPSLKYVLRNSSSAY